MKYKKYMIRASSMNISSKGGKAGAKQGLGHSMGHFGLGSGLRYWRFYSSFP